MAQCISRTFLMSSGQVAAATTRKWTHRTCRRSCWSNHMQMVKPPIDDQPQVYIEKHNHLTCPTTLDMPCCQNIALADCKPQTNMFAYVYVRNPRWKGNSQIVNATRYPPRPSRS